MDGIKEEYFLEAEDDIKENTDIADNEQEIANIHQACNQPNVSIVLVKSQEVKPVPKWQKNRHIRGKPAKAKIIKSNTNKEKRMQSVLQQNWK